MADQDQQLSQYPDIAPVTSLVYKCSCASPHYLVTNNPIDASVTYCPLAGPDSGTTFTRLSDADAAAYIHSKMPNTQS
ncbi:MAG: hypothetical protein P4N59_03480 [Negativicutes bacterium]|nr:hypothetical protein [Negativicutes bacterium]